MTRSDWNDRPFAILFTIVGVFGIVPALYGLLMAGLGMAGTLLDSPGATEVAMWPVMTGFIGLTVFGFWLLLQYGRRALGKPASVPKATLWNLAAVDNAIYLVVAAVISVLDWNNSAHIWLFVSVVWFAFLFGMSAYAASRTDSLDEDHHQSFSTRGSMN